jgi:phage baseplate assembly protein gpV
VYAFKATDAVNTPGTPDNCYLFILSPKEGHVTISTSAAAGETTKLTLTLNGKDGKAIIKDDAGQVITLDTKEKTISLVNSDGSAVRIVNENVTVKAPRMITLDAPKVKITGQLACAKGITSAGSMDSSGSMTANSMNVQNIRAGNYIKGGQASPRRSDF